MFGEEEEGANYFSVWLNIKNISSGTNETFTQALWDLHYNHISSSSSPDATMCPMIRNKVLCCLEVTNRWLNTTVDIYTEKVALPVMDIEPLAEFRIYHSFTKSQNVFHDNQKGDCQQDITESENKLKHHEYQDHHRPTV